MRVVSKKTSFIALSALLAIPALGSLSAQQQEQQPQQQQDTPDPIVVDGVQQDGAPDMASMTKGPEIKGIISGRSGDKMKVTTADGASTIVAINGATKVRTGALFGSKRKYGPNSLMNGLPVTVKTLQSGEYLLATQVNLRGSDYRVANMIRNGTEQQFAEQSAATEALRGRMGDIDKYNIKDTANVYFDTGKSVLTAAAKADLCATASAAEATDNALMLVVGYTDSVGSDEYNQTLSERRANAVINHLQQACKWKPYRMLTPTGMAESDPAADNSTAEGKAQNRRVSVNILVSKSVDGL